MNNLKVVLPGGAGLVGQNLVARLKERGYKNIVVLDKHKKNIEVLKKVQPDILVEYADEVVMQQAQIGGIPESINFGRNLAVEVVSK